MASIASSLVGAIRPHATHAHASTARTVRALDRRVAAINECTKRFTIHRCDACKPMQPLGVNLSAHGCSERQQGAASMVVGRQSGPLRMRLVARLPFGEQE